MAGVVCFEVSRSVQAELERVSGGAPLDPDLVEAAGDAVVAALAEVFPGIVAGVLGAGGKPGAPAGTGGPVVRSRVIAEGLQPANFGPEPVRGGAGPAVGGGEGSAATVLQLDGGGGTVSRPDVLEVSGQDEGYAGAGETPGGRAGFSAGVLRSSGEPASVLLTGPAGGEASGEDTLSAENRDKAPEPEPGPGTAEDKAGPDRDPARAEDDPGRLDAGSPGAGTASAHADGAAAGQVVRVEMMHSGPDSAALQQQALSDRLDQPGLDAEDYERVRAALATWDPVPGTAGVTATGSRSRGSRPGRSRGPGAVSRPDAVTPQRAQAIRAAWRSSSRLTMGTRSAGVVAIDAALRDWARALEDAPLRTLAQERRRIDDEAGYTAAEGLLRDLHASARETGAGGAHPGPLGPDLFGLRQPASVPAFLRTGGTPSGTPFDYSRISTDELVHFLRLLDMLDNPAARKMDPGGWNVPPGKYSLSSQRKSRQWAPGPGAGLLPSATVEVPMLVQASWFGATLRPTGPSAGAWTRFSEAADSFGRQATFVLFTDRPREALAAVRDLDSPPDQEPGRSDWYLARWARGAGIRLVNLFEVITAFGDSPLLPLIQTELAKQTPRGYAAASDNARVFLHRFGGLYTDPDNDIVSLDSLTRIGNGDTQDTFAVARDRGGEITNSAMALTRNHPVADLEQRTLVEHYRSAQPQLVNDLSRRYDAAGRTSSIVFRSGSAIRRAIEDAGYKPDNVPVTPGVTLLADKSWLAPHPDAGTARRWTKPDTLEFTQKVIHSMARSLYNRDGDLHLTHINDAVETHSNPGLVWQAALTFLSAREDLRPLLRSLTYSDQRHGETSEDETWELIRRLLPPRAAGLLQATPGAVSLGSPDGRWLGEQPLGARLLANPAQQDRVTDVLMTTTHDPMKQGLELAAADPRLTQQARQTLEATQITYSAPGAGGTGHAEVRPRDGATEPGLADGGKAVSRADVPEVTGADDGHAGMEEAGGARSQLDVASRQLTGGSPVTDSRTVDALLDPPTSRDYGATHAGAVGEVHREDRAYVRAEPGGGIRRVAFRVKSQVPLSGGSPQPYVVTVRIALSLPLGGRSESVSRLQMQVTNAVRLHLAPQAGTGISGRAIPSIEVQFVKKDQHADVTVGVARTGSGVNGLQWAPNADSVALAEGVAWQLGLDAAGRLSADRTRRLLGQEHVQLLTALAGPVDDLRSRLGWVRASMSDPSRDGAYLGSNMLAPAVTRHLIRQERALTTVDPAGYARNPDGTLTASAQEIMGDGHSTLMETTRFRRLSQMGVSVGAEISDEMLRAALLTQNRPDDWPEIQAYLSRAQSDSWADSGPAGSRTDTNLPLEQYREHRVRGKVRVKYEPTLRRDDPRFAAIGRALDLLEGAGHKLDHDLLLWLPKYEQIVTVTREGAEIRALRGEEEKGFAQYGFPRDVIIGPHSFPPQAGDYTVAERMRDWLTAVIVHELTHFLHSTERPALFLDMSHTQFHPEQRDLLARISGYATTNPWEGVAELLTWEILGFPLDSWAEEMLRDLGAPRPGRPASRHLDPRITDGEMDLVTHDVGERLGAPVERNRVVAAFGMLNPGQRRMHLQLIAEAIAARLGAPAPGRGGVTIAVRAENALAAVLPGVSDGQDCAVRLERAAMLWHPRPAVVRDDLIRGPGAPENRLEAATGGQWQPVNSVEVKAVMDRVRRLGPGATAFLLTSPPDRVGPRGRENTRHAFALRNEGGVLYWVETQAPPGRRFRVAGEDPSRMPAAPVGLRVIVVAPGGRAVPDPLGEEAAGAGWYDALLAPSSGTRYGAAPGHAEAPVTARRRGEGKAREDSRPGPDTVSRNDAGHVPAREADAAPAAGPSRAALGGADSEESGRGRRRSGTGREPASGAPAGSADGGRPAVSSTRVGMPGGKSSMEHEHDNLVSIGHRDDQAAHEDGAAWFQRLVAEVPEDKRADITESSKSGLHDLSLDEVKAAWSKSVLAEDPEGRFQVTGEVKDYAKGSDGKFYNSAQAAREAGAAAYEFKGGMLESMPAPTGVLRDENPAGREEGRRAFRDLERALGSQGGETGARPSVRLEDVLPAGVRATAAGKVTRVTAKPPLGGWEGSYTQHNFGVPLHILLEFLEHVYANTTDEVARGHLGDGLAFGRELGYGYLQSPAPPGRTAFRRTQDAFELAGVAALLYTGAATIALMQVLREGDMVKDPAAVLMRHDPVVVLGALPEPVRGFFDANIDQVLREFDRRFRQRVPDYEQRFLNAWGYAGPDIVLRPSLAEPVWDELAEAISEPTSSFRAENYLRGLTEQSFFGMTVVGRLDQTLTGRPMVVLEVRKYGDRPAGADKVLAHHDTQSKVLVGIDERWTELQQAEVSHPLPAVDFAGGSEDIPDSARPRLKRLANSLASDAVIRRVWRLPLPSVRVTGYSDGSRNAASASMQESGEDGLARARNVRSYLETLVAARIGGLTRYREAASLESEAAIHAFARELLPEDGVRGLPGGAARPQRQVTMEFVPGKRDGQPETTPRQAELFANVRSELQRNFAGLPDTGLLTVTRVWETYLKEKDNRARGTGSRAEADFIARTIAGEARPGPGPARPGMLGGKSSMEHEHDHLVSIGHPDDQEAHEDGAAWFRQVDFAQGPSRNGKSYNNTQAAEQLSAVAHNSVPSSRHQPAGDTPAGHPPDTEPAADRLPPGQADLPGDGLPVAGQDADPRAAAIADVLRLGAEGTGRTLKLSGLATQDEVYAITLGSGLASLRAVEALATRIATAFTHPGDPVDPADGRARPPADVVLTLTSAGRISDSITNAAQIVQAVAKDLRHPVFIHFEVTGWEFKICW
jgi:hypothetical protein